MSSRSMPSADQSRCASSFSLSDLLILAARRSPCLLIIPAPRSPRQNAYVERVIGSIRKCLDHVVVINERHLRRVLFSYVDYYHRSRTHLSLGKDCPDARPIQQPNRGAVIAIPQVG